MLGDSDILTVPAISAAPVLNVTGAMTSADQASVARTVTETMREFYYKSSETDENGSPRVGFIQMFNDTMSYHLEDMLEKLNDEARATRKELIETVHTNKPTYAQATINTAPARFD